jgi:hypothetical protein
MQTFYINLLIVSTIVLILYLIFMGILATFTKNLYVNKKLKPCPDSWKSYKMNNDVNNYCQIPITRTTSIKDPKYVSEDPSNNNVNTNKVINFYGSYWTDEANKNNLSLKELWKRWANSKNITWDTVTNS